MGKEDFVTLAVKAMQSAVHNNFVTNNLNVNESRLLAFPTFPSFVNKRGRQHTHSFDMSRNLISA